MSARRLHAYILLLVVALIWGFASIIIKFTLNGIDPFPFLTYRFFVSAIIGVLALSIGKHHFTLLKKHIILIILYGLFTTTAALGFLFLGLERSSVLELSLITLLIPLLVEVAGVLFLNERITRREKIGTAIALLGTFFTIIEPIWARANGSDLLGNIFLFLYVIADIAGVVILKKLLRSKVSPGDLTSIAFIVGFISTLVVTLTAYPLGSILTTVVNLPFKYHLGVFYMAIMSGTIAYAIRAKAQKSIEIGEGALFAYLTPLFSAFLAVSFLNEKITPLFVIGGIVIGIGVFIAETKSN